MLIALHYGFMTEDAMNTISKKVIFIFSSATFFYVVNITFEITVNVPLRYDFSFSYVCVFVWLCLCVFVWLCVWLCVCLCDCACVCVWLGVCLCWCVYVVVHYLAHYLAILSVFPNFRRERLSSSSCPYVHLSVRLHSKTRLRLEEFSRNCMIGDFTKNLSRMFKYG
jgi:hypothetical protein